jgi:ABC-type multidrug transport system ATPase subunit
VRRGIFTRFPTNVRIQTVIRLDAQGLSQSVNGKNILSNVSLSVHPGEFVGLLGPSGAGKSTLLNALNGFRPAEQGRVLLNGTDLYKNFDRFRSLVGYVPQDDIVHKSLSVYKALYYSALLRFSTSQFSQQTERKNAIKQRVMEVIRTLGLEAQTKTKIKRLSGGQRKRVSLGIELLTSPPLLFLDEPTSGLDPGLEERMMTLFHNLSKEGRIVIITTHIMETLELLDLVALLVQGHLVFYGPPQLALKTFKVEEFSDIYNRLDQFHPAELASQYRTSAIYKKYITSRLSKRYKTEPVVAEERSQSAVPSSKEKMSQEASGKSPGSDTKGIDEELEALKRKLKEQSD